MLVCSWNASKRKNRRENEKRRRRERTKPGKKKREEEEETSRKRTCQSSGSSDGVVLGHGSKRKMDDDLGDDQMQMETEEIAEVEVQRWMDVMLVEEEQIELKDCESTFVEERELDPEKVKEARLEEVQFMQKKRLWDVVPWPKDGCPVSLRWVDVVKGDGSTRRRLVARDFKGMDRNRDDFFAATPPLEAVRAVLSVAATKSSNGPVKKVMMIDAKKAHLNPRCKEDVYVDLPPEVVNTTPQMTCFRGAKVCRKWYREKWCESVQKMATGKSGDQFIQPDNKLIIGQLGPEVENSELDMIAW